LYYFYGGIFMKKLLILLIFFVLVSGSAFAFDILSFPPPVEGGNILLDVGLGLRSTGYSGASWVIPPLFVQVEYALPVGVPISVGGLFTVSRYKYDFGGWLGGYTWSWTDITIATRANWHWGLNISWLDLYTGLSLGWTISMFDSTSSLFTGSDYSGFYTAFQAGAHFYFTQNIGAVAEIGHPYWLKAGLALKF
jgi:hypothetical protein